MLKREFTVSGEYQYQRSNPARWITSHLLRYKYLVAFFIFMTILANVLSLLIPSLTGAAFNTVQMGDAGRQPLLMIALAMLAALLASGLFDLGARLSAEVLGKRLARDSRDELYISLLGKSQTFHNRQRVGDVMARASNDMSELSNMIVPGFDLIFDSFMTLAITIIFIAFLQIQLLLAPLLFTALFLVALRHYSRQLQPVSHQLREQFGTMNAVLSEAVTGIEVVKATAQEQQEQRKFNEHATGYRNFFVKEGQIQGRYLPTLLLGMTLVLAFLHGLLLLSYHQLSIGGLIAYMGLMVNLRYVSFISIWSFSLVQLGIAGAERILGLMRQESDLDENEGGYNETMHGDLCFEDITFGYDTAPVLKHISFHARPGQTIAIVGQTGSGKSSLTKLVNRIYDTSSGRVLVDGKDVREWQLDSLRSQISTIEQDIFLFSRSIAENIAYGLGQKVDQATIERAAKDAQAHDFIMSFKDGYQTIIGERGITLSGGQRQRIAIARALLTNPHILILDDSTSAIDSATEDEIQKAIHRLLEGRTTLLITHRLSQIRWADMILLLHQGQLIDQGTHTELLARNTMYRRIFSHYDAALPTSVSSGE